MPAQIKKFIFAILLICSYTMYPQSNGDTDNTQIINSVEDYLSQASKEINSFSLKNALSSIMKAKELYKDTDNQTYKAKSSYLLAIVYLELEDFQSAKKHILKAIEIYKNETDEIALAKSLITSATIHIQLHDPSEAKKQLEEAQVLIKKNSVINLEVPLKLNFGLLALETNKPEIALTHFNIVLPIAKSYNATKLQHGKARALLSLNQLDEAISANEIAIQTSKKTGHLEMQSKSFELHSKLYEQKGDFSTSLKNLRAHQKLKDSLYTINKEVLAQDAEIRLISGEDKSIIEKLKKEKTQQDKSIRLGRLTTILSIALITILSLLTLSLYKNNNLRARANELLQNKNAELILAKENAERASAAKVQFLSTITHELRTPLYAVTGLTHLLLEESPTTNQKEHLNSLKFSGEYLLSLINNILDLNKLEANKVEIENTSFNLQKRINDVLIALSKSAKDRNNKLHYEFNKGIPNKLKGDPLKISQILINLIGNSIKFTQNGDIWIKVKLVNRVENKVFLSFEISDNGVGISEKKQETIFENFTQGSVQINRKFGGTGLGLSIVKNLLSLMGSQIKLESQLGQGSKFYFDLSFDVFEDQNASFKEEAKKIDYEIMVGKKVLVVEDNKINQLITRKILEKSNMVCDVADNGDIAVNKTKNNQFDLVLMDIHMPGISGIEATRQIREFNKEIPIVALTAVTLDDNLDEFYNNGFSDIIPKPYKTEEFFTKIHKAFSGQKTTT